LRRFFFALSIQYDARYSGIIRNIYSELFTLAGNRKSPEPDLTVEFYAYKIKALKEKEMEIYMITKGSKVEEEILMNSTIGDLYSLMENIVKTQDNGGTD